MPSSVAFANTANLLRYNIDRMMADTIDKPKKTLDTFPRNIKETKEIAANKIPKLIRFPRPTVKEN